MCNCKTKKHYDKASNIKWCSNCLELSYPKDTRKVLKRILGGLFLVILTFSFIEAKSPISKQGMIFYPPVILDEDVALNDSSITDFLVKHGCVLVNVAIGQFHIESSYYNSPIAKENNNVAGIKTSRSKYVIGIKNDHCVYKNVKDCLLDYIDIQNRYLDKIDGHYAIDKGYEELLKKL